MYLSNIDIRTIIGDMNFVVDNPKYPFEPDKQIQLCSIDLRLSNVFWKMKKLRRPLDLRRSFEFAPNKLWDQFVLREDETVVLKPGDMILGRTYEQFTVPSAYAGKIQTRSSYARLGIETSCTCDFINPGWRGNVPLEIVNNSSNSLKLAPYLPVCQIMVIPLSRVPEGTYGDPKFESKYQSDDGGPSRWWRDQMIIKIRAHLGRHNLPLRMLDEVTEKITGLDEDGLMRFSDLVETLPGHMVTNASDVLRRFRRDEKRRHNVRQVFDWAPRAIAAGMMVQSFRLLLSPTYGVGEYLFWIITVVVCSFSVWDVFRAKRKYFFEGF